MLPFCNLSYAQSKAKVTFKTAKHVPVEIYEPIDGAYQAIYPTDKLDLKPSMEIAYEFGIDDFLPLRIKMSSNKVALILFPNDSVTINYEDKNKIAITGNNAEAHTYYNDYFITFGTMFYVSQLRALAMQADNFGDMLKKVEQGMMKELKDSLNAIRDKGNTSDELLGILWADISTYLYAETHVTLRDLKRNKPLCEQQEQEVAATVEQIYTIIAPPSNLVIKYPLGSYMLSKYYHFLYNKMSHEEKQALKKEYSDDTFGAYVSYLLAPNPIRLPQLGDALMLQNIYKVNEFDRSKMYSYLKANYPNSEYVIILAKDFEEKRKGEGSADSARFITEPVNSLAELSSLPYLKGKYLLVDLWATWCLPCRRQFASKDKVKKAISFYGNVELVYISIDKDDQDSLWKSDVESIPLQGHNIRANKSLLNDIKEKIYQGKATSIPRYVLISPEAELLNTNLPLPSEGNELEEALRQYLSISF